MGLRVATLVNLSLLGMDRLEERLTRLLGQAAAARCIPEGVKRFATWAPLLIPCYIPRGADWDYAWSQAETLRRGRPEGLSAVLGGLSWTDWLLLVAGSVIACTTLSALFRWLKAAADCPRWWPRSTARRIDTGMARGMAEGSKRKRPSHWSFWAIIYYASVLCKTPWPNAVQKVMAGNRAANPYSVAESPTVI
jgi:hypothetical protein